MGHHHPIDWTFHPRHRSLQIGLGRAHVQRAPTPYPVAAVIGVAPKSSDQRTHGYVISFDPRDELAWVKKYRAEHAADQPPLELSKRARMCTLLEVSKSGYYEWRQRPESLTQRRRELFADKIAAN